MDWGRVRFFLGEVFANFTRNAAMQLTAIATVAVMVVLLGSFLYTRETLHKLSEGLLSRIEISVFLKDNVDDTKAKAIGQKLARDSRVLSAIYIPRADGLKQLRERLHGQIDTSLLTTNPLPNAYHVRVRRPEDVHAVASVLRSTPGVATVQYAQDAVDKLLRITALLERAGVILIAILVFAAGVIISNTIRLTVFARRREIAIMQLVGATNMYIRWPFIVEGMIDGALGAALAIGLLLVARVQLMPKLMAALAFVPFGSAAVDEKTLALQLLGVGAAVGAAGSWLSVGRHLRT